MNTLEMAERHIRNLGREVIPPTIKRYLWFYYMEMKRMVETRSLDMFGQVHLEINTHCNRTCSYCSNHLFPKKEAYIDNDLYKKVIDELADIGFRGRISPHHFSEPTLHPQLPELMMYASRIKDAQLVLYTDGDFLDRIKFNELMRCGVDQFIITQHGKHAPQALTNLMGNLTKEEKIKVTYQTLTNFNLFNRGIPGLIPEKRRTIPDPCYVADYGLSVLVDGSVVQCDNDFRGENVFGNVNSRSIMDIWNDSMFKAFRREVRGRRYNSDVCNRCIFDASKSSTKYKNN